MAKGQPIIQLPITLLLFTDDQ
ncbi:Protein of unknown function [Bacillus mobilis]|nr:Protein of unknown function [Bacillus mobilis]